MTVRPPFPILLPISNSTTAEYGIQFFFGAFLCDLSQSPSYTSWIAARKWPSRILSPILILIGLLFASYPEQNPEWMPWSNFMKSLAGYIFPPKHPNTARFYSGVGLTFMALGIHLSDLAKHILSQKYLLLAAKNSFAVYLLHGTLMRTVLTWMVFGLTHAPDIVAADGSRVAGPHLALGSRARFWFWLPIWFVFQYWVAHLWTKYVDAWCATVTQKLEELVFEEQEEKTILP